MKLKKFSICLMAFALTFSLSAKDVNEKNKKDEEEEDVPVIEFADDFDARIRKSLVIVEGSRSVGSGFVTTIGSRKYIFTNAHVVVGNANVKFKSCEGDTLKIVALYFCKDRDIAVGLLPKNSEIPALPIYKNAHDLPIDVPVVVTGNSAGTGTATRIVGRMKSIGPDLIETNAKFVGGNSGSPIMTEKGEVFGIATYAIIPRSDEITKDSEFTEIRRFGYRIDNIKTNNWEKVIRKRYINDMKRYKRLELVNRLGMILVNDFACDGDQRLSPSNYIDFNANVKSIVERWNNIVASDFESNPAPVFRDIQAIMMGPAKSCQPKYLNYGVLKNVLMPRGLYMNKYLTELYLAFASEIDRVFKDKQRAKMEDVDTLF